jgi:hypothetical protein
MLQMLKVFAMESMSLWFKVFLFSKFLREAGPLIIVLLLPALGKWVTAPCTYAGGGRGLADLGKVDELSHGKVDLTFGRYLLVVVRPNSAWIPDLTDLCAKVH